MTHEQKVGAIILGIIMAIAVIGILIQSGGKGKNGKGRPPGGNTWE